MRSKFIILILAFAMLAVQMNVAAVEDDDAGSSSDIELLTGLGFMDSGIISDRGYITRAEAASVFAKMLRSSGNQASADFADVMDVYWASGAIGTVSIAGIMTGSDGKFRPSDPLTGTELTVALIRLLGYSPLAVQKGGYPDGYSTVARNIGLNVPEDAKLTYESFAAVVADALDIEVMVSENALNSSYTMSGESYLQYIGIESGRGRITATENSCFYGDRKALKDCVVIDNEEYPTNGTNYDDLMGMTVEFYYDTDDENRIIYIRPAENQVLEISIEDITEVSDSFISYYSGSRLKRVSISSPADIIINGCPEKHMPEDFSAYDNGTVKLVASSGSHYDFVNITAYKTAVVMGYDDNSGILSLKNGLGTINLTDTEPDIQDNKGNPVSVDALSEDVVVSIAQSSDGENISIICSNEVITGVLQAKEDKYVTVNDIQYQYSASAKGSIAEAEAGVSYTLLLDVFGKIAYISRDNSSGENFGYMVKLWYDMEDDATHIKMFETNGTFTTRQLSENVTIDGERYSSFRTEAIQNAVMKDGYLDQLVIYKLDSDGCIANIDTSKRGSNEGNSTLEQNFCNYVNRVGSSATRLKYSSATKIFSGKVVIDDKTKVLFIPTDAATAPEEFFEVKTASRYQQDRQYSVDCYKTDPDSFITDVIIEYVSTDYALDSTSPGLFLVDQISQSVNDDGVAVAELSGYGMKGAAATLKTDGEVDLNSVKFAGSDAYGSVEVGDVIRYKTNPVGDIIYIELYFDESEGALLTASNPSTGTATGIAYSDQHRFIWGNVYERLDNIAMIVRDELPLPNDSISNAEWWEYQVLDKSIIFKFEKDALRPSFRTISKEEIKDYVHYGEADKVLAYTYWGDANTIIIY